jgi:hypothetical protein
MKLILQPQRRIGPAWLPCDALSAQRWAIIEQRPKVRGHLTAQRRQLTSFPSRAQACTWIEQHFKVKASSRNRLGQRFQPNLHANGQPRKMLYGSTDAPIHQPQGIDHQPSSTKS